MVRRDRVPRRNDGEQWSGSGKIGEVTSIPFHRRLVSQAMALQLAVIAFVLIIVSVAVSRFEQAALEEQYGLRAQAVAESVAEIPEVRRLVAGDSISPSLQTAAESIRLRTGVDFVVITDVDRHPSLTSEPRAHRGSRINRPGPGAGRNLRLVCRDRNPWTVRSWQGADLGRNR